MEDNNEDNKDQFGTPIGLTSLVRPNRKHIKIILSIIFICLIIGVAGFFIFEKQAKTTKSPVPAPQHKKVELTKVNHNKNNNNIIFNTLNTNLQQIIQAQKNTTNKLNTQFIKNKNDYESINKNLELVTHNSINSINKIKKLEKQIVTININIKEQFNKLSLKNKNNNLKELTNTKLNKFRPRPFNLVSIDIWDNKPQAQISIRTKKGVKKGIVSAGDIRMGWKIIDINFDKEQITILKNGEKLILEILR